MDEYFSKKEERVRKVLGLLPYLSHTSSKPLTENELKVLKLRYVVGGYTLKRLGLTLNLTAERIRQIEYTALRKLRYRRMIEEFKKEQQ